MAVISGNVLIVANSARFLVEAARNSGCTPIAIDLYGDCDTEACAESIQVISSLTPSDLSLALEKLPRYSIMGAVVGSGLESHPGSLELLAAKFDLLGNLPPVCERVGNKRIFFDALDRLKIAHPEVSFAKPSKAGNWLIKPMRGFGGIGIRRFQDTGADWATSHYWQKYQAGEPHSVLFLADGDDARIVGFNKQWTTAQLDEEFIFSGLVNATDLDRDQQAEIAAWVGSLTREFSLRGLNSLDLMVYGERAYVLEINPRPPASMQLYEDDLFERHIQACRGRLLEYATKRHAVTGLRIVYARRSVTVPDDFHWPQGCRDLPKSGATITAGQPICSIIMRAQDALEVARLLQERQEFIINALERFQSHGI